MPPRSGHDKNNRSTDVKYRLRRAIELRRKGKSYQDIVDAGLFKTRGGAAKAVNNELERIAKETRESGEAVLEQELQRLDSLIQSLWDQATGEVEEPEEQDLIETYLAKLGHRNKAADRLIKVLERRAKLLGLDSPQVVDFQNSDGALSRSIIDTEKLTNDQLLALAEAMGLSGDPEPEPDDSAR